MRASKSRPLGDEELKLDEVFLQRVDRAMLLSKQRDPFQLGQAARAAEEDARIAHLTGAYEAERKQTNPPGGRPRVGDGGSSG
ncbi:hypothetical protein D3C87_1293810 [compost metagenome]